MGANFINTILEEYATQLKEFVHNDATFNGEIKIILSIVSNYTTLFGACLGRM
ncbi:MAG: hypothetical protein R2807_08130 [Chitinophagales bacterium]